MVGGTAWHLKHPPPWNYCCEHLCHGKCHGKDLHNIMAFVPWQIPWKCHEQAVLDLEHKQKMRFQEPYIRADGILDAPQLRSGNDLSTGPVLNVFLLFFWLSHHGIILIHRSPEVQFHENNLLWCDLEQDSQVITRGTIPAASAISAAGPPDKVSISESQIVTVLQMPRVEDSFTYYGLYTYSFNQCYRYI